MDLNSLILSPTGLAVIIAVLLVLSVISIWQIGSGDSDPLMKNVLARIEAGRPPAEVAEEARTSNDNRLRRRLVLTLLLVFAAVVFAQDQTNAILLIIWDVLLRMAETLQGVISQLAN